MIIYISILHSHSTVYVTNQEIRCLLIVSKKQSAANFSKFNYQFKLFSYRSCSTTSESTAGKWVHIECQESKSWSSTTEPKIFVTISPRECFQSVRESQDHPMFLVEIPENERNSLPSKSKLQLSITNSICFRTNDVQQPRNFQFLPNFPSCFCNSQKHGQSQKMLIIIFHLYICSISNIIFI